MCTLCSATGDYAHTLKYCPLNNAVPLRLRSHNFDKARAAAAAGLGQAPVSDDVESEDLEMPSDEGDGKGAAKYLPYLKVKNAVGNYHSLKYWFNWLISNELEQFLSVTSNELNDGVNFYILYFFLNPDSN